MVHRRALLIRHSTGEIEFRKVDINDPKTFVSALGAIRVNCINLDELKAYNKHISVYHPTIFKKTDKTNNKGSALCSKRVVGDVLVVDKDKDLDTPDIKTLIVLIEKDRAMREEASKKAIEQVKAQVEEVESDDEVNE